MPKRSETLAGLRAKTMRELNEELSNLTQKMAMQKLERSLGRLKKTSDLIKAKKLMAQILTVIKEKQNGKNN